MSTTPTNVTVRVIANSGKFLGADIGGALVTIRNVQTGELMASGPTTGGSGDTTDIMVDARTWGTPIPTTDASSFNATLDIGEPCLIEVTAYGPMGGLQSANSVSSRHWVIPGQDITDGDGILMVLSGLLVQVIEPCIHDGLSTLPATVNFQAKVTMMCGCQLSTASGTPPQWDPSNFNMGVVIMSEGKKVADVTLGTCSQLLNPPPPPPPSPPLPSQFCGSWEVPASSEAVYYEAIVWAMQKNSCNTGMARVTFYYTPPS